MDYTTPNRLHVSSGSIDTASINRSLGVNVTTNNNNSNGETHNNGALDGSIKRQSIGKTEVHNSNGQKEKDGEVHYALLSSGVASILF